MTLREEFEREIKMGIKDSSFMWAELAAETEDDNYIKWLEKKINKPWLENITFNLDVLKEYSRAEISNMFYQLSKRDKMIFEKQLDDNPLTFISLMGFEPVKGKENTYVKIRY